jgi:hypothetical protein
MELFTKKNLGVFVTVLTAVMVGLAVHQTMVAPRLTKK